MTWLAIGRWLLARLPHILVAAGIGLLLYAAGEWWAGVRAAPLHVEIARLQAAVGRHEDSLALAAETAALAVQASQDRADAKHREDTHAIETAVAEAERLAGDLDRERDALAVRLREQWAAGRAAGRRDRDGVPPASGDRHPAPAGPATAGVVPGPDHRSDQFDIGADIAVTGERAAAVCRILHDAAREGRCIRLRDTP